MFTSTRTPNSNKYKYFLFVNPDGVGSAVDVDILIDHRVDELGILYLTFENNEHVVHRKWRTIDYGYNKPQ